MRRTPVLAVPVVLAVALTAGCSGSAPTAAAPVQASPSASAPAVVTKVAETGVVDPLTGRSVAALGSVVAVKVDNGVLARPYQRGLDRAALVYQELTEGGSTRFAAIFDGTSPAEVGPVRSMRETDFELLRPYGRIAIASSGGNPGTKRTFQRQVRAGRALDASYDALPRIYRLGEQRRDARNFFTSTAKIVAARPTTGRARDVGFRFGELPTSARQDARSASVRFSKFSLVTLEYVASAGSYRVRQDGRLMKGVAPANVVVQRVQVRKTRYKDTLGLPTPYSVTTGSGDVTVLRDGKAVTGTWKRPTATSGTRLSDAAGADILLRPGATWVLLVPVGQPVSVS